MTELTAELKRLQELARRAGYIVVLKKEADIDEVVEAWRGVWALREEWVELSKLRGKSSDPGRELDLELEIQAAVFKAQALAMKTRYTGRGVCSFHASGFHSGWYLDGHLVGCVRDHCTDSTGGEVPRLLPDEAGKWSEKDLAAEANSGQWLPGG